MADIVKFSFNLGSVEFDFDSKKIMYDRSGSLSKTMHLSSMVIDFADVTDVEMRAAKMLKVPAFCVIVNGNRLMTDVNINATQFTLNKSDAQRAKDTLERLVKECNLSGIKEYERKDVPTKIYTNEYFDAERVVSKALERNQETRKRCNVCGHIFCYNQADIAKNKSNARQATVSSIGGIAGALGGAYAASAVNTGNAQNSLNKIVDFNRCPQCNSTNLSVISDEEFEKMQAQKNTPQQTTVSAADELKKFKELLDMGAITQEEFDVKKKELLGL